MGCHCESAPRPWQSVSPALRFLCLRRLPFFLRQKKGRKERRQNQGFGILYAAGVSSTSVSSYLADRDVQNLHLAFAWSLRWHPLAAHAGPRCPDAAGKHSASAVLCATFLAIVRRGRCPHRPALLYFLSPVGRGDHTSPPGIAPQLMKKPCHCEPVSDVTAPVAIRFPQRRGFYVSDGSLSFCGKRKGGKNAAKTKVLESFSRLRCRPRRSPLTSRTGMCKICTLLSYDLCGAIRWPLTRARAALTQQGYTLRLPCYAQHFLSSSPTVLLVPRRAE